jgi:hypothetical protein
MMLYINMQLTYELRHSIYTFQFIMFIKIFNCYSTNRFSGRTSCLLLSSNLDQMLRKQVLEAPQFRTTDVN